MSPPLSEPEPGEESSVDDLGVLRNRTFDELQLGESASLERTLTQEDIQLFAIQSGDVNPAHLDAQFAASTRFHGVVAHGMWGAALISAVLGTRLPGPGTIYLSQSLHFRAPVRVGDTLRVTVTVASKDPTNHHVVLTCSATGPGGQAVIDGEALVLAPTERIVRPRTTLPGVHFDGEEHDLRLLLTHAAAQGAVRAAIVPPYDAASLSGWLAARDRGLIEPVVVAPAATLAAVAAEAGVDLAGVRIVDVPHRHAAAARAAHLAAAGEVDALLMHGSRHATELLEAVVDPAAGLRTRRRITHCFLVQTATYPRPFIITDAALNTAPSLEQKADIVRNAIDLAQAIGVASPRVAVLAAVETVNPRMRATLDAAALCKMADRGQIVGGLIDGPLAFDTAVSLATARSTGFHSPVAGQADVLVVPDLESGTMLVKQLESLGGAASAGVILGARVPVVITHRTDSRASQVASCALAVLVAHRRRAGLAGGDARGEQDWRL